MNYASDTNLKWNIFSLTIIYHLLDTPVPCLHFSLPLPLSSLGRKTDRQKEREKDRKKGRKGEREER